MKNIRKFIILAKNQIAKLPKSPGVYAFKKQNEILYIGKAANLRERVKSHFKKPGYRQGLFISQIKKIGYIKTESEIEALILEASLIKKYQPRLNVAWKDDKNYFYAAITREDYPRIFITHQPQNLKSKISNLKSDYVGPFVDGQAIKQTLKLLRRVFPYRTCKVLPKKACLWHELGRCPAPCVLKPAKTLLLYSSRVLAERKKEVRKICQENVRNLVKILQGGRTLVLKNLKREMQLASERQEFEKAGRLRDQIKVLQKVLEHTRLDARTYQEEKIQPASRKQPALQELRKLLPGKKKIKRIEGYDVSNIQGQEASGSMVVFENGRLNKNGYRKFKIRVAGKPDDLAMLAELMARRFRHKEWKLPDIILIDGGRTQLNLGLRLKEQNPELEKTTMMALAKKRDQLFLENKKSPLSLKKLAPEPGNLIRLIRDESHRFASVYHKKLRTRAFLPNNRN